jgi:hypothetical protein
MTKDEALTMALEVMHNQGDVSTDDWIAVENAIKAALAQTEQWTPEDMAHRPSGLSLTDWEAIAADQALTIAMMLCEQEPVEYQYRTRPDWIPEWNRWNTCSKDSADAYEKNPYLHDWHYEVRTLYAAPPKRQSLTDSQILQLVDDCTFGDDLHADKFARAIEQAHGIGNKT